MRKYRIFCLMAIISSGLVLTSEAQKKPGTQQQIPPLQRQTPSQEPKVNPQMLERNKVPVRQLFQEMFSQGRYELEGQVFAPGCTVHFGNRTIRLQEAVAEGKGWRSAAPDLVMAINEITISGDMVNVVWSARGTHNGQGHGLKPTGKRISMQSRSQFKVVNGKIVEAWNEEYRPELFRQLGVSKTGAFLFFAAERILAALDPIIPDRFYALF
jgi:predicted ester cyclase